MLAAPTALPECAPVLFLHLTYPDNRPAGHFSRNACFLFPRKLLATLTGTSRVHSEGTPLHCKHQARGEEHMGVRGRGVVRREGASVSGDRMMGEWEWALTMPTIMHLLRFLQVSSAHSCTPWAHTLAHACTPPRVHAYLQARPCARAADESESLRAHRRRST